MRQPHALLEHLVRPIQLLYYDVINTKSSTFPKFNRYFWAQKSAYLKFTYSVY